MKLGWPADILKVRAAIQHGPGRLEERANRNFIKFSKNKCQVLQLGRINPLQWYWGGTAEVGQVAEHKPPACPGSDGDQHLAPVGRSTACRLREPIFSLYLAHVRSCVDTASSLVPSMHEGYQWTGTSSGGQGWSSCTMSRSWGTRLVQPCKIKVCLLN